MNWLFTFLVLLGSNIQGHEWLCYLKFNPSFFSLEEFSIISSSVIKGIHQWNPYKPEFSFMKFLQYLKILNFFSKYSDFSHFLLCQRKKERKKDSTHLCPTLGIPQTEALQAPLSMGFSRQEYRSGLPFPSPGDLPNPGIEPRSPTLQVDALLTELHRKPQDFMPRFG